MDYARIGAALQRAREKAGLSQAEVAARLGITGAAVSLIESGHVRAPLSRIEELARVVGASAYLMIAGEIFMELKPTGEVLLSLPALVADIAQASLSLEAGVARLLLRLARVLPSVPETYVRILDAQVRIWEAEQPRPKK